MSIIWTIIGILIITAILKAIYKVFFVSVEKMVELKDTSIDTPLDNYLESHAVSNCVKSSVHAKFNNVSKVYEEKCVLNPENYEGDPAIPEIIKIYSALINGEILDPGFKHMPTSVLKLMYYPDEYNEDYIKYLKNQLKGFQKDPDKYKDQISYIKNRLSSIEAEYEEQDTLMEFKDSLKSKGIPEYFVDSEVLTETKLNSYDEKDWVLYVKTIKNYLKEFSMDAVYNFFCYEDDIKTLSDYEAMTIFSVYFEREVHPIIACNLISGTIDEYQAEEAIEMATEGGSTWAGALNYVINSYEEIKRTKKLKDSYKGKIR